MRNIFFTLSALLAITSVSSAETMVFSDTDAEANDGIASYVYDFQTGAFGIQLEGSNVGLIDAQSVSGIFNDRTVPGGLFPVNTENRLSVVINAGAGTFLPGDTPLANIGAGLDSAFLASDLSLLISQGFGSPNVTTNLIVTGGSTGGDPVLAGDPAPGTISLQDIFNDGSGRRDGGIMLSNSGEGDFAALGQITASFESNDGGLFDAEVDGDKINLLLDVAAALQLPIQDVAGVLNIDSENGGSLQYTLTARVPEPATFGLAGLALVGLVGLRRRS